MDQRHECLDCNEATARVAYAIGEVTQLYPMTPASPMTKHCGNSVAAGQPRLASASRVVASRILPPCA